jgi:hypothetical protein
MYVFALHKDSWTLIRVRAPVVVTKRLVQGVRRVRGGVIGYQKIQNAFANPGMGTRKAATVVGEKAGTVALRLVGAYGMSPSTITGSILELRMNSSEGRSPSSSIREKVN